MSTYLNIIQIIVATALITLIIMQSREAGLGRMFGGGSAVQRTRRGVEKTLYNVTIIMAVVFFVTSLLNVLVQS